MPRTPQPDALAGIADVKFNEEKIAAVHDLCSSSAETPDSSRKGTFDREIQNLLEFLNAIPQFVSTSSCSGRVILFSQEGKGKGACRWHLVCHEEDFSEDRLVKSLEKLPRENDVVLKFEPFILHVRCKTLSAAQNFHALSVQAGFRNSGITIRRKGKEGFAIHVAVRSTLHFEMPVILRDRFIVSADKFSDLAVELREKMNKNASLIVRFFEALKTKYSTCPTGEFSDGDALQETEI